MNDRYSQANGIDYASFGRIFEDWLVVRGMPMKICRVISGLRSRDVGKPLVELLSRIYREGGDGGFGFSAILPDETSLGELVNALTEHGCVQSPRENGTPMYLDVSIPWANT